LYSTTTMMAMTTTIAMMTISAITSGSFRAWERADDPLYVYPALKTCVGVHGSELALSFPHRS